MRAVVQRVSRAQVTPGGEIGRGLCVLLGVACGDGDEEAMQLAGKVARLRIFPGDDGRFDRSVLDVAGAALVVSQFTLIADTAKGNRPNFAEAVAQGMSTLRQDGIRLALAGLSSLDEVRRVTGDRLV